MLIGPMPAPRSAWATGWVWSMDRARDRPLDLNVDDLQAEAGPVDPDPRHGLDQVLVELARVVLDRDVGIGRRVEACPQALEQPLPIGRLQDRWRAAAQVHVANLGAPGGCTWQAGWWPSPFS